MKSEMWYMGICGKCTLKDECVATTQCAASFVLDSIVEALQDADKFL